GFPTFAVTKKLGVRSTIRSKDPARTECRSGSTLAGFVRSIVGLDHGCSRTHNAPGAPYDLRELVRRRRLGNIVECSERLCLVVISRFIRSGKDHYGNCGELRVGFHAGKNFHPPVKWQL